GRVDAGLGSIDREAVGGDVHDLVVGARTHLDGVSGGGSVNGVLDRRVGGVRCVAVAGRGLSVVVDDEGDRVRVRRRGCEPSNAGQNEGGDTSGERDSSRKVPGQGKAPLGWTFRGGEGDSGGGSRKAH